MGKYIVDMVGGYLIRGAAEPRVPDRTTVPEEALHGEGREAFFVYLLVLIVSNFLCSGIGDNCWPQTAMWFFCRTLAA